MAASRLIAPLAGAALAAALYPATYGLDAMARGSLGPGFWPRLALIGLGLGCLAKLVEEWRRPPAAAEGSGSAEGPAPISRGKLALGIGAVLLYVALTPWLGFPLATGLFIAAFMPLCGIRSATMIAANVGVGTVGLLYLFVKLVYLPLPKGDGPFEALTLALYRALHLF